jgi:uncharacterized protein YbaR (Trm112 family)
MIALDLLEILRCPETRQRLALADPATLEACNARIAAGEVQNLAGQTVADPLPGALVRADGQRLYPIRGEIPILLVEEGIAV